MACSGCERRRKQMSDALKRFTQARVNKQQAKKERAKQRAKVVF